MKMHDNDTIFEKLNTPESHSPMSQRMIALVLIAIPCLMIVLGLFIDTLIGSSASSVIVSINLVYVVIPMLLIAASRLLLRNNPSPLIAASRWTMKSYEESIAGLDERERQVIDRAYRTSYRVIALVCWIALSGVLANLSLWHLTYHIGQIGVICIIFGVVDLLSYLPTTIVLWKEEA